MVKKAATLHFGPPGNREGFAGTDVGQHRTRNSHAIVREFIQNSLDAAKEAKQPKAVVRFAVRDVPRSSIPCIDAYKAALDGGIEWLKSSDAFFGPNKIIAEAMCKSIRHSNIRALFVTDNGIGLDDSRMGRLLGDGMSGKPTGAGSHGVGHFSAFGATAMHYVLYGGVTHEGTMTASAHAILASHRNEKRKSEGKDGYYAVALNEDLLLSPEFVKDGDIAPLIKDELDKIQGEWKSGSAVIVPAFNSFGKVKGKVAETIQDAAAQNFFPAIFAGDLVVEVVNEDENPQTVDKTSIIGIMDRGRERKRAESAGFVSGRAAGESFDTLVMEKAKEMKMSDGGIVNVYLRQNTDSKRIAICRDGMWITGDYGQLNARLLFPKKVQFDALFVLNEKSGAAYQAVRIAETPLHNDISKNELGDDEEKQCALDEFHNKAKEFLNRKVKDFEGKETPAEGFLDVLSVQSGEKVSEGLRSAYSGKGIKIPPTRPIPPPPNLPLPPDPSPNPRPVPTPKPPSKSPPAVTLRASQYREPESSVTQLKVVSEKDCADAVMRLRVDSGADDSCTNLQFDNARISRFRKNSDEWKSVPESLLIPLGKLQAKVPMRIDVEFAEEDAQNPNLTLFCEVQERTAPTTEASE